MNFSLKWFEIKLIYWWFPKQNSILHSQTLNFTWNLTQNHTDRLDRNSKGGGIILYDREDIPSKLINSSCTNHGKEYFLVELNLRKQKWLIICNYNPHKTRIKGYLECISKEIDSHSSKYNFLLLGDFNSKPTEEAIKGFCQIYNFKNLLDKPTCYKNPNPSCVDLILTNRPRSFQNCCTFETGLTDFLKSIKFIFCKTKTKSTKLLQLQIL